MEVTFVHTPLGTAKISGDSRGISSITLVDKDPPQTKVPEVLQSAVTQLTEYMAGQRQVFDLKICPKGTDFQQKVWQELKEIPYGKTVSYMELSKKLGNPKAIRAVAAANGKNPIWIVIPCHRVIGSDGSMTGYAGGIHRKKWLINHESPVRQSLLF